MIALSLPASRVCPAEVHRARKSTPAGFEAMVGAVVDWGDEAGLVSGECQMPGCHSTIAIERDVWLEYAAAKAVAS